MPIKKIALAALAAGLVLASATLSFAQDATSQTPATAQASPDSQQQAEEKAKLERKATVLLEQVISEAQALKLPENRTRVQIAASDPKYAYQKAMESLDKNEYPTAVGRVLAQLQAKDKEAFEKLSTRVINKLTPDSLMASREADNMALNLLRPGPRPAESPGNDTSGISISSSSSTANTPVSNQVLNQSTYHDLLN